jgi:hypothetical protein
MAYLQQFVKVSKTLYQKKKPKTHLTKKILIQEEDYPVTINIIDTEKEENDIIISSKKHTKTGKAKVKNITDKNTTRKEKEI